jgi:hypothetical protein
MGRCASAPPPLLAFGFPGKRILTKKVVNTPLGTIYTGRGAPLPSLLLFPFPSPPLARSTRIYWGTAPFAPLATGLQLTATILFTLFSAGSYAMACWPVRQSGPDPWRIVHCMAKYLPRLKFNDVGIETWSRSRDLSTQFLAVLQCLGHVGLISIGRAGLCLDLSLGPVGLGLGLGLGRPGLDNITA